MAETISKFNQMARTLAREHNRPLTFEELEKHLDISLNGVRDALRTTQAKVVFIDNLVDENGPAGKLSLAEKVGFIEKQLGKQVIDLVLSNKQEKDLKLPVIGGLQSDEDVYYRHNTSNLLAKLEEAAKQLLVESA